MTLRDYFAGQALASMATDFLNFDGDGEVDMECGRLAKIAYFCADRMIIAREETN